MLLYSQFFISHKTNIDYTCRSLNNSKYRTSMWPEQIWKKLHRKIQKEKFQSTFNTKLQYETTIYVFFCQKRYNKKSNLKSHSFFIQNVF